MNGQDQHAPPVGQPAAPAQQQPPIPPAQNVPAPAQLQPVPVPPAQVPQPAAGAGPGPLGGLTNYRDYYDAAQNDPFGGQYEQIMQTFQVDIVNAAAPQPAALANQVYTSAAAHVPMAFLLLCCDPVADPAQDPGKVILFHRQYRFPARIGLPATPWDDQGFATKGDVVHQQAVTIQWPQDYFHQAGALVRVPTIDQAVQQMATHPMPMLLGPFGNNDAGTEVVRTRRSMYVPPRYVSLFLDEDLTPAEAFTRLVGAVTADGTRNACLPLITWLRVAFTRNAADAASILEVPLPTVPLADQALLHHRWELLMNDLPGLARAHQSPQGMHEVAGQIGHLVTAMTKGQDDARVARLQTQTKTPEQFYGPRLQSILRLCQVASSNHLPALYGAISNSPKNQERAMIQQYMDEASDLLNIGHKVIVTPSMVKKVASASWSMEDENVLETGLHYFHFTYRTPRAQEVLRHLVDTHSMVSEHKANPSLQDAQALLAADKIDLPVTWSQVRYTLQNMLVASSTALGAAHGHTRAMSRLLVAYNSNEHVMETMTMPPGIPTTHAPAYFIRWLQLRFSVWIDEQLRSPAIIPVPVYDEIFRKIRLNEYWLPTFPPGFIPVSTPSAPTSSAIPSPAEGVVPQAAGAAVAADTAEPNSRVNNLGWKNVFQPYKSIALRVRDLRQRLTAESVNMPKRTDGQTRCLAWHVKGMCNENCGNKVDHIVGREDDDNVLLAWCQQHWHE